MKHIKMLYWREARHTTSDLPDPKDCIRTDIAQVDRDALAAVLRDGKVLESWRGIARCRICQTMLGSQCLGSHGFQWPQRAEHYILQHGVWTPECNVLLLAASAAKQGFDVNVRKDG